MVKGTTLISPKAYECEKCQDRGYVDIEKDGYVLIRPCECAERKRAEKLLEYAGIGDAFRECRFDRVEEWDERVTHAKRIAQKYANSFFDLERDRKNSLALLGAVGSGKTMLGMCVINQLMKHGVQARYTPFREMVGKLKSCALDEETHIRTLSRYVSPRVLFIDDIFRDAPTDADIKHTYDVINARYLAKKPVIITSERSANELIETDEAIGSRIIEQSRDYIYEMRGQINYRLRGL